MNSISFFFNQYLLSPKTVSELSDWHQENIGNYILYTHNDLEVSISDSFGCKFILIGYAYDFRSPRYTNQDIVNSLDIDCDITKMLNQLQYLSGVYLIIWKSKEGTFLIPDMCALRQAFIYQENGESVAVGSTPNILKFAANIKNKIYSLNDVSDLSWKKRLSGIGNASAYENTTRLRANHYYCLENRIESRFFPNEQLKVKPAYEAVKEVSRILPSLFDALQLRGERIMVGLTGGWDSRLLLAASKEFKSKFLYFVNIYPSAKKYDHSIPMRLASKLGISLVTVQMESNKDSIIEGVNTYVPNVLEENLVKIAEFKKLFPGCKCISGAISEVTRNEFGRIGNVTGAKLASLNKVKGHADFIEYYNKWLTENTALFKTHGYDILDMFYWEEVLANRLGKSTTECHAYGHSIFPLFNCRYLIQTLLAVDPQLRHKQHNKLYTQIINTLWSKTLSEPINPSFKKRTIKVMQFLGIYTIYRNFFTLGLGAFRR